MEEEHECSRILASHPSDPALMYPMYGRNTVCQEYCNGYLPMIPEPTEKSTSFLRISMQNDVDWIRMLQYMAIPSGICRTNTVFDQNHTE